VDSDVRDISTRPKVVMTPKVMLRLAATAFVMAALVLGAVLWATVGFVGAAVGATFVFLGGIVAIWELKPFMELRSMRLARDATRDKPKVEPAARRNGEVKTAPPTLRIIAITLMVVATVIAAIRGNAVGAIVAAAVLCVFIAAVTSWVYVIRRDH